MADPKTPPPILPGLPDYPGQSLDAAIRAAILRDPVITGHDMVQHVLKPKDFDLVPMPDETRVPFWPAGTITVDDRASLSAYVNRFRNTSTSILVADIDSNTITARLDWHHEPGATGAVGTGADRHRAKLVLRVSEEFKRWDAFEGKLHPQADFARFLEENASDIAYPDPATMIEISRDFEATAGHTYKSSTRLDNGDRRMIFTTETNAQNDVIVPQKFSLHIPIWHGEDPDTLTALFRWRATGNAVQFGFEWHRVEYQRRAHFRLIATTAAEETGLPVYFGRLP